MIRIIPLSIAIVVAKLAAAQGTWTLLDTNKHAAAPDAGDLPWSFDHQGDLWAGVEAQATVGWGSTASMGRAGRSTTSSTIRRS
jgi:hypothetical protein